MRYKTKMRLSLVALTALTVIFLWALWTASNAVLTGLAFRAGLAVPVDLLLELPVQPGRRSGCSHQGDNQ